MKLLLTMVAAAVLAVSLAGAAGAGTTASGARKDIVQTAAAAGKFTTLATLLNRAGLVAALRKPGPYTVFAPTDAAFAKLPKRKLNALKRRPAKLRAVLLYHVAAGRLEAADVVERSHIKTLNGKRVRIRVTNSKVFVNRARVTTPDVGAANGVIHVINRVLLPPKR